MLEYAEAMSQTPPAVTDELSERLLDQLGAPALLELTAYIAAANMAAATTWRSASRRRASRRPAGCRRSPHRRRA